MMSSVQFTLRAHGLHLVLHFSVDLVQQEVQVFVVDVTCHLLLRRCRCRCLERNACEVVADADARAGDL